MSKNTTAAKSGAINTRPAAKPAPEHPTILVTNSVCTSSEPLVRQAINVKISDPAK